jgi:hypothetical protein
VKGSSDSLHANLGLRIREALQFVTASEIVAAVETETDGTLVRTRVRAAEQPSGQQRQLRFLERDDPAASSDFATLFDRYLRFVLTWRDSTPHPISIEWNAIIASSQASVESQALVLSVAVESLLQHVTTTFPTDLEEPDAGSSDRCLQSLKTFAVDISCPETFRNRLNGFISNYKAVRSVDKLYALASSGKIDTSLIEAWKALRHPAAHGTTRSESVDETLRLRDAVLALLYQITFLLVVYIGKFTNFAAEGWPEESYPLAVLT